MGDLGFNEYQNRTQETAIYPGQGSLIGLVYAALGLGEAGEVQGKVKKILRDHAGVMTDDMRAAIAKELGDILWYAARVSKEIGMPLADIAEANLDKLADRKARGVVGGSGDER